MPFPEELLGPLGLLVGLIIAVVTAFRGDWVSGKGAREREAKLEADARTRETKWEAVATSAMDLMKAAQESNREWAAALAERNRIDAEQMRLVQAGLIDEYGKRRRRPTP